MKANQRRAAILQLGWYNIFCIDGFIINFALPLDIQEVATEDEVSTSAQPPIQPTQTGNSISFGSC